MTRGLGGQSPANVEKFLSGVRYPASKQDLIEQARHNRAPDEILETIGRFATDRYGGPQDVMKAYGELH